MTLEGIVDEIISQLLDGTVFDDRSDPVEVISDIIRQFL